MPVDPQVREFLDEYNRQDVPPVREQSVEDARWLMEKTVLILGPPEQVAEAGDLAVPGPDGDIRVRLYKPQAEGPLPVVVYFHGGGWVTGSLNTHDNFCRALANAYGGAVLSVGYRLAPEHKYPAAAEDAYAATKWAAQQAEEFGLNASRIAVAGDSAGGNLAAAVALMARDRGGPPLACQVLIYPAVDTDFERPSYRDNAEGYMLTADGMKYFWEQYLPDGLQTQDPFAAPMRADDLSGLPPAIVVTAHYDVLRDEGDAYAARLEQTGVPTTHLRYDGMIHGFLRRLNRFDVARQALDDIARSLRQVVGSES